MTQTHIFHKSSFKLGVLPRNIFKKVAFCATFSAETQLIALFFVGRGHDPAASVIFFACNDEWVGVAEKIEEHDKTR